MDIAPFTENLPSAAAFVQQGKIVALMSAPGH